MTQQPDRSTSASWARFRFSVVGSLLSSPPTRGQLKAALRALADKTWTHPVNGGEVRFSVVTIERWYYTAQRGKDDPVGVLRRAVRRDCGKATLTPALAELLRKQYHDHPVESLGWIQSPPRTLAGPCDLLPHQAGAVGG